MMNYAFSKLNNEIEDIPYLIDDFYYSNYNDKQYIKYGADNHFPFTLIQYYKKCSVLQCLIDGTVDFICGEGVKSNRVIMNSEGETFDDIIREIANDFILFGGFALQVIRNIKGEIKDIYVLDFSKIRVSKKIDRIFYSNDWVKYRCKAIEYKPFDTTSPTSIFYYKGNKSRGVYPLPLYHSCLMSILTQIKIKTYHLENISNNFCPSAIINFNNGIPTEEEKRQVEKDITDKFSGAENASKLIISWNEDRDKAVEIEKMEDDNFDSKYQALNNSTIQDIFTAFRAPQQLFGTALENIGFNNQEYIQAFKIYQKTVIGPIQKIIKNAFNKIDDTIIMDITPFNISDIDDTKNNEIK